MIPLGIFLLACAAVYLGAIDAAFSALMRLSLRLVAERSNRPGALGDFLDDPLLLFLPVRLLIGLVTGAATALVALAVGVDGAHRVTFVIIAVVGFVIVCEVLLPLLIVGRDPERILDILLPSFTPMTRMLGPTTRWIARSVASTKRPPATPAAAEEAAEEANETAKAYIDTAAEEGLIEGEERKLLQSIVDFGDTLVREVVTPRPGIGAIKAEATVGDLRALFREQEYGRFVFSGKVDIDELTERLRVQIEREGFETVGGYLMSHIGRVPTVGERFEIDGLTVEILDAERRRVNKVRIYRHAAAEESEGAEVKSR